MRRHSDLSISAIFKPSLTFVYRHSHERRAQNGPNSSKDNEL